MVKKTAEKRVKKPVVTGAEVKSANKAGPSNNMIMLAVIATVVLIAIAYVIVNWSGKSEDNIEDTAELPSFSEALTSLIESAKDVDLATVDVEASVEMTGLGVEAGVQMGALMKYDGKGQKAYTRITASVAGAGSQSSETYLIGNVAYSQVQDPYTGTMTWIKESGVDVWGGFQDFDIAALMEVVDGQVVGLESKDGKEALNVAIRPDIAKMVDKLLESQSGELSAAGLTEADLDELAGQIASAVKSVDGTAWLDKESMLPIAFELLATLEIDLGLLSGMGETGIMATITVDLSGEVDYETPVSIEVPASVINIAKTVDELYGTLCGDGYCDTGEDAESCPEDCGIPAIGCGNGICEDVACMAIGCPVPETPENCPEDCAV